MSTIFTEIDKVINNNTIFKLSNELSNLQKNDNEESKERCVLLRKIIEYKTNPELKTKNNLNVFLENSNKFAFNKTWAKLFEYHKIMKIIEFATDNYGTHKKIDIIKDKLITMIKEKELNTSKIVQYDMNNAKITNIVGLIIDEEGNVSIK